MTSELVMGSWLDRPDDDRPVIGGWHPETPEAPAALDVADPLVRPIVPIDAVREDLAAKQQTVWWDNAAAAWKPIDISPAACEARLVEFVQDLQDRSDERWRNSGAFQRAVEQSLAAGREEAADRAYARKREQRREQLRDGRLQELLADGYNIRDAQKITDREFPEG